MTTFKCALHHGITVFCCCFTNKYMNVNVFKEHLKNKLTVWSWYLERHGVLACQQVSQSMVKAGVQQDTGWGSVYYKLDFTLKQVGHYTSYYYIWIKEGDPLETQMHKPKGQWTILHWWRSFWLLVTVNEWRIPFILKQLARQQQPIYDYRNAVWKLTLQTFMIQNLMNDAELYNAVATQWQWFMLVETASAMFSWAGALIGKHSGNWRVLGYH